MELLSSEPGCKFINEPLNREILNGTNVLPIRTRWNYLSLTSYEEQIMKDYFQNDDRISCFGPISPFSNTFDFITNRRVIKVIRANALIEWFINNFDYHIIYLIRHPIAQALSCISRGHRCEINEYMRNRDYIRRYLSNGMVDRLKEICRSGSAIEMFVAEWCLENVPPLTLWDKRKDFLVLTYEELVLKPRQIISVLCRKLNLKFPSEIMTRINQPSRSTDSSTKATVESIKNARAQFLISKWEKEVNTKQKDCLFEILNIFEIDTYSPTCLTANDSLMHF